jgi:hypothetical protein
MSFDTKKIGVGTHTHAEVQISFLSKTIKLVLLRFENGALEDSYSRFMDVPWFGKDESLDEIGRMVLVTAEHLGLVAEGKTEARIIDVDSAPSSPLLGEFFKRLQ